MTPGRGPQGGYVVVLTFVAALILAVLPLPDWAQPFRPDWPALAVIYWCLALPERVGVGVAWTVGLLVDVLKGALMGQYALAFAAIAFLTLRVYRRVRIFPIWQQAAVVLALLLLQRSLFLWVNGMIGKAPGTWLYWLPALTGALAWPMVFYVLRQLRRRYRVR
jgi:rod shape-determining protein MreD